MRDLVFEFDAGNQHLGQSICRDFCHLFYVLGQSRGHVTRVQFVAREQLSVKQPAEDAEAQGVRLPYIC